MFPYQFKFSWCSHSFWRSHQYPTCISLLPPCVLHALFAMVLPGHSGPCLVIKFRNHFSETVRPLGRVISSSQGLYLNRGQHKHTINACTPNIHALSGIRTHDHSIRASEDSSCLRQRGYRDRHATCPAHIILLDLIVLIIVYLTKDISYESPHVIFTSTSTTSSLLGPNILLRTFTYIYSKHVSFTAENTVHVKSG
jgi:hypothetical protein